MIGTILYCDVSIAYITLIVNQSLICLLISRHILTSESIVVVLYINHVILNIYVVIIILSYIVNKYMLVLFKHYALPYKS